VTDLEHDPMWPAECRRILLVPPAVPDYPLHLTLPERRLRMLAQWESIEALKLARAAGLPTP
jgi:hypothetical protein